MSRLVLSSSIFKDIHQSLFRDENEACVILFGRSVILNGKLVRLVVRDLIVPLEIDYDIRTFTRVQLKSDFIATITKRARGTGESIIFVHSHPGSFDQFSKEDDDGEKILSDFLKNRTPNAIHASLLLTQNKFRARILGKKESLTVHVVGTELNKDSNFSENAGSSKYERQIRAFGKEGHEKLSSLTVAIVGLGGTGSIIAQQLAHLGVNKFHLVDPDVLEESNLNRVVGTTHLDLGKAKVDIIKRLICSVNPNAHVKVLKDSILKNSIARNLTDADFIFGCTDSHGSRAILNQLAYQYLVPTIDMGMVINVQNKKIEHIAARTQLLAPGLGCMVCGNLLDYEEVRRDLLTDFERKNDPYIPNETEPAPAVISLNCTISSMAITMFLSCVAGIPGNARLINYNAMTGVTRPAVCPTHPTCIVCSKNGSFAMADDYKLPGRLD